MKYAIDVSNYSGPISDALAQALVANGITRVIVQLVNERVFTHRDQIPALLRAGIEVQGYVYVWFSAGEQFVRDRVWWACLEMEKYPGVSKMMWLDCEQADSDTPPFDYVHQPVSPSIRQAVLAVTDSGFTPGIYTAKWWWVPGASNSLEWSQLPLWVADYDLRPVINPVDFGGWGAPAMKQYEGNTSLAGISKIDVSSYAGELTLPPPVFVPDVPRALAALERAVEELQQAATALRP